MNKKLVLYIHGKGGSAAECEHYKSLFPDCDCSGLDYKTFTPWETGREIEESVNKFASLYEKIILIANSIGAYFSMNADICTKIERAYFISPVVDMEKMILNLMSWAGVSEDDLKRDKIIKTDFGEDLSWDYLCYVRAHPLNWTVPTKILYGSEDNLVPKETVEAFARKNASSLTVMQGGEHWFHTDEQMKFLDEWIKGKTKILETERLFLRQMTLEDTVTLALVLSDPESMRFYPHPFSREEVENWIKWNLDNYQKYGFGLWAVCLKESGEMIGDCGITMQQVENDLFPEIGYHLRKEFRGKGYATEVAKACAEFAKGRGMKKIISYMKSDNLPSRHVAERNGMKFVKAFTKTVMGKVVEDEVLYMKDL